MYIKGRRVVLLSNFYDYKLEANFGSGGDGSSVFGADGGFCFARSCAAHIHPG